MIAPCALCGNRHEEHDMAPVRARRIELACQRCVGVIRDRTRNIAHGHALLDGRPVVWRASADEPGAAHAMPAFEAGLRSAVKAAAEAAEEIE